MPGMMDTVLNLGLNDVSVGGLAKQTDNPRFAYDSYRRFVQMFGKIVLDIDGERFEHALEELREQRGVDTDPELSAEDLEGLVDRFKAIVLAEAGIEFPQDPKEQLRLAIEAVFRSWNGERARIYRRMEKIPDDLGTAVNVQTMVFGNKGDDSGTGVAFTRDPATGENRPVRRLPEERAGRRRRRRHPRHRAARRDGQRVPRVPPAAARAHADAPEPLPRHVRHRVHHRAGPPVPAADPRRQAHRGGRAAHGRRDGGGGPHRPARGGPARAAGAARPAPPPAVRPGGGVHRDHQGPQRVARRRGRQGLLHRRLRRGAPRRRRGRHPGAARDLARRPPRHDRGRGHPHVARRAREPRRGRRARHGHARGVRRERARHRRRAAGRSRSTGRSCHEGDIISINGTTGEVVDRPGAGRHPRPGRAVRDHARLGRRLPPDEGAHQRRPARTTPHVARRFGAEGIGLCRTEHMFLGDRLPARAAVHPRRRPSGGGAPRSRSSRSCSAATSRASSRRWTACPSPSACSTRRCTSSSPTSRSCSCATRRASSTPRGAGCSPPRSSGARPTRCSARVAAASGSSSPVSTGCRPRRSSKRRWRASAPAASRTSRS